MPDAKFVHLVRDGRKVTSSYFHKLGAECYDDRSTSVLQAYFDDQMLPAPPPEKKYWWPLPRQDDPRSADFRRYDQFARIAWHWAEINARILVSLDALPRHRQFFVRLEDLVTSPRLVNGLLDFLNLSYRPEHFEIFARPHNVNRPEDRPLTEGQLRNIFRDCVADDGAIGLWRTRRIRSELLTLNGERWLPDCSGGLHARCVRIVPSRCASKRSTHPSDRRAASAFISVIIAACCKACRASTAQNALRHRYRAAQTGEMSATERASAPRWPLRRSPATPT